MSGLKINTRKHIDSHDLDRLVQETYNRPYCFAQQDGCRDRGIYHVTVPADPFDYEETEIPEEVNGEKMGVSFAAWLARDPKAPIGDRKDDWVIDMFWEGNFYP